MKPLLFLGWVRWVGYASLVAGTFVTAGAERAVVPVKDYADVHAAAAALPEAGGVLLLPPGEFELHEPLVLDKENVVVRGAGVATHLINRNEEGRPALWIRPPGRLEGNSRVRLWRVEVRDVRLSGNGKSGDGIRAEGINEIFIDGVSVERHGGNGIALIDCYEDPRVTDNLITYNGKAGLRIEGGHDIVVNGNQFEENQDGVQCVDSFNLCMNGNNLDDHLRDGVVIENTYGSVLSGNMIEECQGRAIVLDRDCYGITISANVIAHEFTGGIDLVDAWGCAISANTFTIVHEYSLRVGKNSGRITVTGNNFSNSHIGGKDRREDPAGGVVIEGMDVAVSGNLFSGMAGKAILAEEGSARVLVDGNLVVETGRKGAGVPGVDVERAEGAKVGDQLEVEERGDE